MKKVLILGTGGVGQRHMRNVKQILGDVKFIVRNSKTLGYTIGNDLKLERDKPLIKDFNLDIYDSEDQCFLTAPDLVVVSSPSSNHYIQALRAIEMGIPLYIEKPCVTARVDYIKLLDKLEANPTKTCIGFQMRANKTIERLGEVINNRALGELLYIHAHVGEDVRRWHPYEDFRKSYSTNRDQGGGVVLTQIHEFDLIEWITKGSIIESVGFGSDVNSLNINVESAVTSIHKVFVEGRSVPCAIHQNYYQHPKERYIKVIGTNGYAQANIATNVFTCSANAEEIVEDYSHVNRNDQFLKLMKGFLMDEEPTIGPDIMQGYTSHCAAFKVLEDLGNA